MKYGIYLVAILMVTLQTTAAPAQVGRLVKEGVEAVGKKAFGRAAREATEEGAELVVKKAASTAVRKAGQETAEAAAKRAGIAVSRYTDDAARAVGRHGSAVAAPLVNEFGDEGAKALVKLSPTNARRMAILTEELGVAGRGTDWMRVLADKGDVAAEWVWKNKGTVTVATVATAFLANPEAFLQAGEAVASTTIETAGKHVAQPLVEKTVEHVVPMAVEKLAIQVAVPAVAALGAGLRHPWLLLGLAVCLAVVGFVVYRWYLRPWLRLLCKAPGS